MRLPGMRASIIGPVCLLLATTSQAQDVTQEKISQLNAAMRNTNGQIDTTDVGVEFNSSRSLRAGPRGYNLFEDVANRKKFLHFDRERVPERVVHALGHGAYGTFESYGDWSNLTMACWLQEGAVSEVFTRFSVVVASVGGSESGRDVHGFATKIYSPCGNNDLVGNSLPSFFIDDGAEFPGLIHSVKYEADKGFPTGGTAHRTAYDFFTSHPEGSFQLMQVLSDLGIPRDIRHISGNGVHTFRFLAAEGKSTLFKWYWMPRLGHRSLVYDEATKIAGKNNNFQRVDLYNTIAAGIYPEWDLAVQLFPDDGSYMWNGYDLLIPTQIVPFEVNPPITLGKLTLNRNFQNFFAEPEAISFAPSNVVDGISFVPDPLLQWRLMSYDDTATHRHGSPNGYTLPVNQAVAPVNNNYRDGYMQPYIFEGDSTASSNNIGGVRSPSDNETLQFTAASGESAGAGKIGRYTSHYDWFGQARTFWSTMDVYAQQHTVDGYRFELGNVGDAGVVQRYIDGILNNIDNCLARRVAWGVGAVLPATGSGPVTNGTNGTATYPSLYPLNPGQEDKKSNAGLQIAVVASDTMFTQEDMDALTAACSRQNVSVVVVAPRIGQLNTGVEAVNSFVTTSDIFYDAIIIGSLSGNDTALDPTSAGFVMEAYGHGKAIGALGSSGMDVLQYLDIASQPGIYAGAASTVANQVLDALSGPVRFPQRFPTDDVQAICG
ncbi:hypothetical protein LTR62_003514 [Meristemomyces frigidus]|uniref:Catalase n=1 Tax=Meristemomyces frigidus TaxID=1508187 RepID=A0AAN7TJA3_9PEZI|nr:hypothetical protein LTR62_003514 [Meristemomyces frigidus]